MHNIVVTAKMRTPVISTTGYLTLDALLAARIFEMTGSVERAHNETPVGMLEGMPMASAAIHEDAVITKRAFTGSLRVTHELPISLIEQRKTKQQANEFIPPAATVHRNPFETKFKSILNSGYQQTSATSIRWYAHADADAVSKLLDGIEFIGKRRSAGFGQVQYWSVDPTDANPLADANGHPLRPIPAHLYTGPRDIPMTDAAWRPAYWDIRNRSACFVPAFSTLYEVNNEHV